MKPCDICPFSGTDKSVEYWGMGKTELLADARRCAEEILAAGHYLHPCIKVRHSFGPAEKGEPTCFGQKRYIALITQE